MAAGGGDVRRQPDFSTLPRERRPPGWERLALALAVLALAASVVAAWRARAEADEARSRLAGVRRQLDQQSARSRVLATAADAGASGAAAADAPPVRILAGIEAVLPGTARLRALSIEYGRGVSIEMQVEARSAASWDRLLEGLERSPDFKDVEPGPENREAEVRAMVRARWAGGTR